MRMNPLWIFAAAALARPRRMDLSESSAFAGLLVVLLTPNEGWAAELFLGHLRR
jgi:hypothetical protein